MTALRDAFGQRGELCQQGSTANTLKERAGIESIHLMQYHRNVNAAPLQCNRGDWTPLEPFVAGVRGWEAAVRRRMAGEKWQTKVARGENRPSGKSKARRKLP